MREFEGQEMSGGVMIRWLWLGAILGVIGAALLTSSNSHADDSPDALPLAEYTQYKETELGERLNRIATSIWDGSFSGSILIARGDEIVISRGFGYANVGSGRSNTQLTVFDAGSLAKTFTAIAVLQLAEAGKLQLDQTLGEFFDQIPDDKRSITIDQVLTHTAGLPQYHGGSDFDPLSRSDALEEIFDAPLRNEPAAKYRYSNSGHSILAAIIENISGTSWSDYLEEHIFLPAGMKYTGFYGDESWKESGVAHGYVADQDQGSPYSWLGPSWVLIGGGGLVSNVPDLYQWHRALQGGDILGPYWMKELVKPRISSGGYIPGRYKGIRELPDDDVQISYFGWRWRGADQVLILEKGGSMDYGHTALFRYEPELDVTIVLLSNHSVEDDTGLLIRVPLMDALHDAVVNQHSRAN